MLNWAATSLAKVPLGNQLAYLENNGRKRTGRYGAGAGKKRPCAIGCRPAAIDLITAAGRQFGRFRKRSTASSTARLVQARVRLMEALQRGDRQRLEQQAWQLVRYRGSRAPRQRRASGPAATAQSPDAAESEPFQGGSLRLPGRACIPPKSPSYRTAARGELHPRLP